VSALIIIGALIIDRFFGELRRGHPLVGFGNCANWLELRVNRYPNTIGSITFGALSVFALVAPIALLLILLKLHLQHHYGSYAAIFDLLILYWAIGLRSLQDHIQPIQIALESSDIDQARQLVSHVVSRDSAHMETDQITSAAIETTIENGCDAVFSVLFWYFIGGPLMVIVYRLVNTLDAMWGYRNERFESFGKTAAKLDDLLNYLPARVTALTYGICGNLKGALNSWRVDAPQLDSPNAGPVMTAGAGSLNLRLGGNAIYQGQRKNKHYFGGTETPIPSDITRALRLVNLSTVIWCGALLAISLINLPRIVS